MAAYQTEITAIDITSLGELSARVTAFDEQCSDVLIGESSLHTVESWRELSAKIEAALLLIHPTGSAKGGEE